MNLAKETREVCGVNMKTMAGLCGVHRQTWGKWERGEAAPSAAAQRLMFILSWLSEFPEPVMADLLAAIDNKQKA